MKKLIIIDGHVSEKDTTANKLNIMSAKEGKSLTEYIRSILNNHVKGN